MDEDDRRYYFDCLQAPQAKQVQAILQQFEPLAQVTCRLYPTPACSRTLVVSGGIEPLSHLAANLRNSALTPVALDWLSPALAKYLDLPATYALAVRFQSIAAGVTEQIAQLESMVATQDSLQLVSVVADDELWTGAGAVLHRLNPGQSVGGL